mgnify:CR=1 FL=1
MIKAEIYEKIMFLNSKLKHIAGGERVVWQDMELL